MPLRTMLAEAITPEQMTQELFDKGPLYLQPKYDGIRVQTERGVGYSGRNGKMLPNNYVQSFIQTQLIGTHLDGEMMVKSETGDWLPFADILLPDGERIRGIESHLMTSHGAPDFCYVVFDCLSYPSMGYGDRYNLATTQVKYLQSQGYSQQIQMIGGTTTAQIDKLLETEDTYVAMGYEGLCARVWNGPYKQGRSTLNERYLLKHKRTTDAEAYIIGMEPLVTADGRITNTMGALICICALFDEHFKIGTGFTPQLRQWFWDNFDRDKTPWRCTFKYQPHGTRTRPRSPVFKNLRNSD